MMHLCVQYASTTAWIPQRAMRVASAALTSLLCLSVSSFAFAQPEVPTPNTTGPGPADAAATNGDAAPTLRVAASPTEEVRVGEPFVVTVDVTLPAGWSLVSVRPDGNTHVQTLDVAEVPSETLAVARRELTLAIYRPGRFEIPRLLLLAVGPDGGTETFSGAGIAIEVSSSISHENDPQPATTLDFATPSTVYSQDLRPLYAAGVLGAAIFGFLLAMWWRRRARRAEEVYVAPPRPAYEIALERLDALVVRALVESGEHVAFYLELSAILKEFIGATYDFHASESTTSEIRRELAARHDEVGEHANEILSVLEESDFVKFARYAPPETSCRSDLEKTRDLVLDISAAARDRAARAQDVAALADADAPTPDEDGVVAPPEHKESMDVSSETETTGDTVDEPPTDTSGDDRATTRPYGAPEPQTHQETTSTTSDATDRHNDSPTTRETPPRRHPTPSPISDETWAPFSSDDDPEWR